MSLDNLTNLPRLIWIMALFVVIFLPLLIIYILKEFEVTEITPSPPWIKLEKKNKKRNKSETPGTHINYVDHIEIYNGNNVDKDNSGVKGDTDFKVLHNLPQPDYGVFIGREKEKSKIIFLLKPYPKSQHAVITIDGIGGVGKSTLALEVALHYLRDVEKIPSEERFNVIVWTSAKTKILTVDGIAQRQNTLRTLEDIFNIIAGIMQIPAFTNMQIEEKEKIVKNLLTKNSVLLIVDNLETIDDEELLFFLRELPAPTKAIITSRYRLDVSYPIRLVSMEKTEAINFITNECNKKGVLLTDNEMLKLYDRTCGVPLAMVWSVAQIAFGYSIEAVIKRLGQQYSDISRFCFEGVINLIRDTVAYDLLAALALSEFQLSRNRLGFVAGVGEDILSRDEGLVSLEKLSLIQKTGDRFNMLPLVRQYIIEDLHRYSEKENSLVRRLSIPKNFFIDEASNEIWVEGIKISSLTEREFDLIYYLYQNAGQACSISEIAKSVYGIDEDITDNDNGVSLIISMINRLRQKIEPDVSSPRYIITLRKRGIVLKVGDLTD